MPVSSINDRLLYGIQIRMIWKVHHNTQKIRERTECFSQKKANLTLIEIGWQKNEVSQTN